VTSNAAPHLLDHGMVDLMRLACCLVREFECGEHDLERGDRGCAPCTLAASKPGKIGSQRLRLGRKGDPTTVFTPCREVAPAAPVSAAGRLSAGLHAESLGLLN